MIRAFLIIIRLVIGGTFIYAGYQKALDPYTFSQSVIAFKMLPYIASVTLSVYLPWLEIIAGVCLITGFLGRGATYVLLMLALVFVVARASALMRGIQINCDCFGGNESGHDKDVNGFMIDALLAFALIIELWITRLWTAQKTQAATTNENTAEIASPR
jgi:putative oxidoreductase